MYFYDEERRKLIVVENNTVRELDEIGTQQVATSLPRATATPHKPKNGKARVCSICEKPGHDVRKCPDGKGLHPDNSRTEPQPKQRVDEFTKQDIEERLLDGQASSRIVDEVEGATYAVVGVIKARLKSEGKIN